MFLESGTTNILRQKRAAKNIAIAKTVNSANVSTLNIYSDKQKAGAKAPAIIYDTVKLPSGVSTTTSQPKISGCAVTRLPYEISTSADSVQNPLL